MPLISIICPIYNTDQYLKRCFDSVLQQTFTDFEFILINDCSTDNSKNICLEYQKKDNRVIYIEHKNNSGISITRNTGLNNSNGKYIAWIDSDDWIDNDYLEILYKNLLLYNADISIIDVRSVYKYQIFSNNYEKENIIILNNFEGIKYLIEDKYIRDSIYNKLIKKEIYKNLQFENRLCEDAIIMHYLIYSSNIIVHSNLKKYNYFYRIGSLIHRYSINLEYDRFYMLEDRYNFILLNNLTELINNQLNLTFNQGLKILLMTLFNKINDNEKQISDIIKNWMNNILINNEKYIINNNIFILINGNIFQKIFVFLRYEFKDRATYYIKYNFYLIVIIIRYIKSLLNKIKKVYS